MGKVKFETNNNKKTLPIANEDVRLEQPQEGIPHLERYDLGLQDFLKRFFVGDVTITPTNNFWELYIKNSGGDIKFPAVSFYPVHYGIDRTVNSFSMQQQGFMFTNSVEIIDPVTHESQGRTAMMSKFTRALYIDIDYEINVWALTRSDALQLTQEIMFPLFNHKEYLVSYFDKEFYVAFDIEDVVVDNSQFGMNQSSDVVYRYTFNITTHAMVFDSKNHLNVVKPESGVIERKITE